MSRITDLLSQVTKLDPQLGADLDTEVKALSGRRAFGLNFERHQPEAVELPGRPVRRGDKVRVLPARDGSSSDSRLWVVASISSGRVLAEIVFEDTDGSVETASVAVDDLVVVAEFRDPIYPGLVSTGHVERGGPDKPFHTVINAENFHALEALAWTHEGKVDAIYIDPPYNTGAKDWKYNNDYVDGEDLYRHSKWLAFMERRLKLAKRLLNPDNSVLIVTIDEKEYLRLGLLLQQTFPEAIQQMATIVISAFGSPRAQALDRVEEFAFFVWLGAAAPTRIQDPLLGEIPKATESVRWESLLRSGSNYKRSDRPNLFFPVYVDLSSGVLQGFGDSRPMTAKREEWPLPEGCGAFWPTRKDGTDGRWQVSQARLQQLFDDGYAKLGKFDPASQRGSIYYLTKNQIADLGRGVLVEVGRDADGSRIVLPAESGKSTTGKSVWFRPQHAANLYGTSLVKSLLGGRAFPFPKSLYAVEDALRLAVGQKMDAVVVDFFSGSGTTAHAVMRLNKQDGGRRQCISVTNNEVSADEQKALRAKGLRPGDPEWEALGICDYITKPRIKAAITGLTPDGDPIKGDYKFTDEFPMSDGFEENAEFFTLTYEAPLSVRHGRSFKRIAPLLWLRAGAQGRRIDEQTDDFDVADTYAVLFDLDYTREFIKAVVSRRPSASSTTDLRMAFIVTDDDRGFQQVVAELPEGIEPVRLYSSYLTNFSFTGDIE